MTELQNPFDWLLVQTSGTVLTVFAVWFFVGILIIGLSRMVGGTLLVLLGAVMMWYGYVTQGSPSSVAYAGILPLSIGLTICGMAGMWHDFAGSRRRYNDYR